MQKPICLVTGVGDQTGSSVVKRFSDAGYHVAMIARNKDRLLKLETSIKDTSAYPSDIANINSLLETLKQIKSDLGSVEVLIHNAVSHTFGTFLDADPEELERNFRVNTTSLLYLARELAPDMIAASKGSIIATGNTASLRGVPNYALFAPTKAAQRILCQSLARELGPSRIHVGYVTIDAAIDAVWLGKEDEERPDWLRPPANWQWEREDFFAHPDGIANEIFHMVHQHHTVWSFETVIRPFAEKW